MLAVNGTSQPGLTLQALDPAAEPLFLALFCEPQVMRHIGPALSITQARARFNTLLQHLQQPASLPVTTATTTSWPAAYFQVQLAGVGAIGLAMLLPGANASEAELGRMLLPAWQQQGLGTQLSRLLIAQAGRLGGIETLSKRIQQQNLAALHSAAKLGFKVSAELADGFLRLSRPLKLNPAEESRK